MQTVNKDSLSLDNWPAAKIVVVAVINYELFVLNGYDLIKDYRREMDIPSLREVLFTEAFEWFTLDIRGKMIKDVEIILPDPITGVPYKVDMDLFRK